MMKDISSAPLSTSALQSAILSSHELASSTPKSAISVPFCTFTFELKKINRKLMWLLNKNKTEGNKWNIDDKLQNLKKKVSGKLPIMFSISFHRVITDLQDVARSPGPSDAKMDIAIKCQKKVNRWLQISFWMKQKEELTLAQKKRLHRFKTGKIKRDVQSIFETGSFEDTSVVHMDDKIVIGDAKTLPLLAEHLTSNSNESLGSIE